MGRSKQIASNQMPDNLAEVLLAKLSHLEELCGDMKNDLRHYREDNEKLREENNQLRAENEELKNELREPYSIKGLCKKLGVCENTLTGYRERELLDCCSDGQKLWFREEHLQEFYRKTDSRYKVKLRKAE